MYVQHICDEVGIQLQHTKKYHTLQQNGVAEWKNQSLKDMASWMLRGRSLPSKLWAEST
jgi:transposase InsO family protein